MTDTVTITRADAEAAVDALTRHWERCGGTRADDDLPLRALLTALGRELPPPPPWRT